MKYVAYFKIEIEAANIVFADRKARKIEEALNEKHKVKFTSIQANEKGN